VLAVDHRLAVHLPAEARQGTEDLARLSRLGDPHPVLRLLGGHAIVQVEEDDRMSQVGEAGDGASAAVFGVAGMPAGDDHLPPAWCILAR
jgi:hypothetical protein